MNKRQEKILESLEEVGELSVEARTSLLKTSPATVRRDLTALEEAGILTRTFGKAKLNDSPSLVVQTFEQKRERMRQEKERIAKRAAELVDSGMIVALDSGTTTWRLAANLRTVVPLQVITSALSVVEELGAVPGVTIFCPGGDFRLQNLDFIGEGVRDSFSRLHADIAFISGDSYLPGKGVYANESASAEVGRAMAGCADTVVAMLDHGKIDSRGRIQVVPESRIDMLITDSGVSRNQREQLSGGPFKLIMSE